MESAFGHKLSWYEPHTTITISIIPRELREGAINTLLGVGGALFRLDFCFKSIFQI